MFIKILRGIGRTLKILLLILLAALVLSTAIHQIMMAVERQKYPSIGDMVSVDGKRMSVYVTGSGKHTIVLMPGLGTASPIYDFLPLAERLAENNRVVIVEPFGYGWSDNTDTPRTVENIVSELRAALKAEGIEGPYVLMPHSISGLDAIYYANAYPEEVAAVVGIDCTLPTMNDYFEEGTAGHIPAIAGVLNPMGVARWITLAAPGTFISENVGGYYSSENLDMQCRIASWVADNHTVINQMNHVNDNMAATHDMTFSDQLPLLIFTRDGSHQTLRDDGKTSVSFFETKITRTPEKGSDSMPLVQRIDAIIPQQQKLRTAAYTRVSRETEDQLHSFAAQESYYQQYIDARQELVFAGIYSDEGITGTSRDRRDGFNQMIEDCKNGKLDLILTKSVTRFGRNLPEAIVALREIRASGVHVVFETNHLDTRTMQDDLLFRLLSMQAEQQSLTISRNVKLGYRHRALDENCIISRAAYGYRIGPGKLLIDPEKAEVVRYIFHAYLSGTGITTIAKKLEDMHIPSPSNGKQWYWRTIWAMLQNERYAGDTLFQKTIGTDTLPFRRMKNSGQQDQYYLTDTHVPLITREEYDATQQMLQRRKAVRSARTRKKRPFSQKIFCGHCGKMFGHHMRNQVEYWVCKDHFTDAGRCPMPPISEQSLEQTFVRLYNKLKLYEVEILHTPLAKMQKINRTQTAYNEQLQELNAQIQKAHEQCLTLSAMKAKGFLDDTHYLIHFKRIDAKLIDLNAARRNILKSKVEIDCTAFAQMVETVHAGPERIEVFNPLLLELLVTRIDVLDGRTLQFHLVGGLQITETIEGD